MALRFHLPVIRYAYDAKKPNIHAMGIPHQMPSVAYTRERKYEAGTRKSQSEHKVINIGISVSPAPRITALLVNIAENNT